MSLEPWMIWGGAIVLLLLIFYNRMVYLRNKVRETFKDIDVYLEQRFDTLTKLAESVASYTDHEASLHTKIAKLRQGFSEQSDDEKIKRSNEASRLVRGFHMERYPNLKASNNYLQMQKSINHLEGLLSASKRTYNARVNQYNTWTQMFPMVLISRILGFARKEYLHVDEQKKQDVDIRSILRG